MPTTQIETMSKSVGSLSMWYAIYTRHQHEKTVAQILTSKGFDTFLPLYRSARTWNDRTKMLDLPLFPCYVFLQGGFERRAEIITTPGIHFIVSSGGQPAAIPPCEIDVIRRAVESGSRVEPHPLLECGNRVRVKSGPLAGVEGILVRKKNSYRLVLSVEMLGKAAAVEVDLTHLEASNERATSSYHSATFTMADRLHTGTPRIATQSNLEPS
jgi:transcription antitermination factor NusG